MRFLNIAGCLNRGRGLSSGCRTGGGRVIEANMSTIIQKHLLQSFRKVLKPFIKLLVRAGVTYVEFSSVVKSVYVECAAREAFNVGSHPSRARISMITGVPRR